MNVSLLVGCASSGVSSGLTVNAVLIVDTGLTVNTSSTMDTVLVIDTGLPENSTSCAVRSCVDSWLNKSSMSMSALSVNLLSSVTANSTIAMLVKQGRFKNTVGVVLSSIDDVLSFSASVGSNLFGGMYLLVGSSMGNTVILNISSVTTVTMFVRMSMLVRVSMLMAMTMLQVSGITNIGASSDSSMVMSMRQLVVLMEVSMTTVLMCSSSDSLMVSSGSSSGVDYTTSVSSGVDLANTALTTFQMSFKFKISSETFLVLKLVNLRLSSNLQESVN